MQIAIGWAFGEYESHILQQITKFMLLYILLLLLESCNYLYESRTMAHNRAAWEKQGDFHKFSDKYVFIISASEHK